MHLHFRQSLEASSMAHEEHHQRAHIQQILFMSNTQTEIEHIRDMYSQKHVLSKLHTELYFCILQRHVRFPATAISAIYFLHRKGNNLNYSLTYPAKCTKPKIYQTHMINYLTEWQFYFTSTI